MSSIQQTAGIGNLESASKYSIVNNIVLSISLLLFSIGIYVNKIIPLGRSLYPTDMVYWFIGLIIIDMILYFFLGRLEAGIFLISLIISFFELVFIVLILPENDLQWALIFLAIADVLNLSIAFEEIRGGGGGRVIGSIMTRKRSRSNK